MQLDPLMLQLLMWDLVIFLSVIGYLFGFYLLYKYRLHSPEYELGKALIREQAITQSKIIMGRINRILTAVYPEILHAKGEISEEEKAKIKIPEAEKLSLAEIDEILTEARQLGILKKEE